MIFSEFLDNTETKRYYEIIENSKLFPSTIETYTEKHHIIPTSFFKNNKRGKAGWLVGDPNDPNNLVVLTGREHFICHQLLTQMLPKEHSGYDKMSFAFFGMCRKNLNQVERYIPTPEEYESARILHAVAMSKSISEETRQKIISTKQLPESRIKASLHSKGRPSKFKGKKRGPRTEEAKKNMSNAQKGLTKSKEHREKMSKFRKGKPLSRESVLKRENTKKINGTTNLGKKHTQESKANMSKAQKGKKQSPETIAKRESTKRANKLFKSFDPCI
jgi:hypothetical protein